MPINFLQLLLHDVPLVFESVGADSPEGIMAKLEGMAGKIFHSFDLGRRPDDLWINGIWETGPKYGYKGFPDRLLDFPSRANPQVNPLPITLATAERLQDAFRYLFTNRDGHWNCSNRTGGYQVMKGGPSIGEINRIFQDIIKTNDSNVRGFDDVPITRSVMMHLVWPYVFPAWYKETRSGYSQISGMMRLSSEVDYHSGGTIRKKHVIDVRSNYGHYAAVYRIFLWLYKSCVATVGDEPHFDCFTQLLAEIVGVANPLDLLRTKQALVLYGVPGTGKTHTAEELAKSVIEGQLRGKKGTESEPKLVQFHPGYSYADFIIGIRPETVGSDVSYRTKKGTLYELAELAATNPDQDFCLIIDEINRANLAEVLGEAMFCLEYRKERHISLPQVVDQRDGPFKGGTQFYLPNNLYVIGTMNHADRSISGFDMALRRRFAWYKLEPMTWVRRHLSRKEANLEAKSLESFLDAAYELNECIANGRAARGDNAALIPFNADHQIGDSYFAAIEQIVLAAKGSRNGGSAEGLRILPQHRETLWLYYLRPLLEDYLGNDIHSYEDVLSKLGEQFVGEY